MVASDVSDLDAQIEPRFRLPAALWDHILPLLPVHPPNPLGGRPRADDRRGMEAVLYLLTTGIQWRALPRCYGPATTAHDHFQEWVGAGVFENLWKHALLRYDEKIGLQWTWQSMDGAMTKAPLGGECTGPNPTDRAKGGVKRSLQTEGAGIPIGLAIAPANRHDCKLVTKTLESRPVLPPPGTSQHMCLDKGSVRMAHVEAGVLERV
jgi:putative transposase